MDLDWDSFVLRAKASGLVTNLEDVFEKSFKIIDQKMICKDLKFVERLAQVIAEYLRVALLTENRKFSFETVFLMNQRFVL